MVFIISDVLRLHLWAVFAFFFIVHLFGHGVRRVVAERSALLLPDHYFFRGERLASGCVDKSTTDCLERNPLVLPPEVAVRGGRLAHQHPHLLERTRPEPPCLALVHDCVVDIVRLHDVEVAPALERLRLLLQVTVRRVWPPYLALGFVGLGTLAHGAVGVRPRSVHNVVALHLKVQHSAVLVALVVVTLKVRHELLVPFAEELIELQSLNDRVLGAALVGVCQVRPWAHDHNDYQDHPEATSLVECGLGDGLRLCQRPRTLMDGPAAQAAAAQSARVGFLSATGAKSSCALFPHFCITVD